MLAAAPAEGSSGLKLTQLFRDVAAQGQRRCQLWIPPQVLLPTGSPWLALLQQGLVVRRLLPSPGLLLLSDAADWLALRRLYGPASCSIPKLQVFWGSDGRVTGHGACDQPAIRVALGDSVAQALRMTACLREPLHTLPLGLDPEDLPPVSGQTRQREVLVLGGTNPALGLAVQQSLHARGLATRCELVPWEHQRWQQALAAAAVAVVLAPPPGATGLGLRRLTAMAVQTPLVCEQRQFDDQLCRDGYNAVVVPGDPEGLAAAVVRLLGSGSGGLRRRLIDGGLATLVRHRRALERLQFAQLLDAVPQHWAEAGRCHSEKGVC